MSRTTVMDAAREARMDDERDNSAYPKSYGAWAGDPAGNAPDFDHCCVGVWSNERWSRHSQCSKKRGYGPGKAYCKIHDPASVKARQEKAEADANAKWNSQRYSFHGRAFYSALEEIANGHNDARGLAAEVIAKFKAGEH